MYLQRLKKKTEQIMAGGARFPFFSLASLLTALSLLYGAGVRIRAKLYSMHVLPAAKLPCPVISIGNLTIGGTGKTPMTLHLAKLLQRRGYKVLIISRGYKSRSEKKGAVVSDGRSILCDARQAGDEPFLMATLLKNIPVVVGRQRYAAGLSGFQRFQPDLILLDDAYQHLPLARDLNLLLLDFRNPFGNMHLLPRGPLRESVSSLSRADAIVVTRCPDAGYGSKIFKEMVRMAHPRSVFCAAHVPVRRLTIPSGYPVVATGLGRSKQDAVDGLHGRKVFAFAALARNQNVWNTIAGMGADLQGTRGFADHHPYSQDDIHQIVDAALKTGSDCLATTEKDLVRIPRGMRLPLDLIILGIDIDFKKDRDRFEDFVVLRIQQMRRTGSAN